MNGDETEEIPSGLDEREVRCRKAGAHFWAEKKFMKTEDKTVIEAGGGIVVFSILKPSACAECGVELWKGSFLRMEKEKPLCLECADLDHLVFLPRGDVALTRRSRKYSVLSAVVVRFSRSRKRYERQGLLVESGALETRAGRMPQRRRKAPRSHGRRLRSPGSKPTISTSRNSWIAFALDTRIALRARLKRLRSTRVRSTAGESAALLRQSHLMRRQLTLRSRLTFVIRTPSMIGCCREGGNERRRGLLSWAK